MEKPGRSGQDLPDREPPVDELAPPGLRDTAALRSVVQTLFQQAPIGIGILDNDRRFLTANRRLREMTGYAWPELIGMSALDLVHPDDRARIEALAQELRNRRIDRFSAQKRMVRPDGETWWASCILALAHPPRGDATFTVELMEDVTEEKRVAEQLRDREQLLNRIFEYAPIGIAVTDENAHYVRANRRFLALLGYTESELLAMTGWDVIHPEDRETSARLRDELFSGLREDFSWERRYLKKDGVTLWVLNTVFVVAGGDGAKYAVALIEDTTQRRLADAAIYAAADRLHALSRRLVELQEAERRDIARELHDRVGQTLTAMRINMDMIRTRLAAHDDAEIRRRNDDSMELIESAFKAVENVMYELRPPMLEEYGVTASLQWLARQFTARTHIQVEVRGDEKVRCTPEVELAAYRIAQEALTNIARHSHATRVTIVVQPNGPEALVIEDNGTGFDVDNPGQLSGYGMITMRERAEAVGAKFEVRSAKGTGTRIALILARPR